LKIRKIAGRQQSNSHAEAPLTIAKYNSFFIIVKFEKKLFWPPPCGIQGELRITVAQAASRRFCAALAESRQLP
jgi:hypothetical protein